MDVHFNIDLKVIGGGIAVDDGLVEGECSIVVDCLLFWGGSGGCRFKMKVLLYIRGDVVIYVASMVMMVVEFDVMSTSTNDCRVGKVGRMNSICE